MFSIFNAERCGKVAPRPRASEPGVTRHSGRSGPLVRQRQVLAARLLSIHRYRVHPPTALHSPLGQCRQLSKPRERFRVLSMVNNTWTCCLPADGHLESHYLTLEPHDGYGIYVDLLLIEFLQWNGNITADPVLRVKHLV